jgi:hypothetical protein
MRRCNTKAKIPLNNGHLNNEGQEWKPGHAKGRALSPPLNGTGKVKEGSKEGEYDGCTFYTRIQKKFKNLKIKIKT